VRVANIVVQNSPSAKPIGGNPKLRELCQCGCGEPAPIATQTSKKHGRVKGQPCRFINGHSNRITKVKHGASRKSGMSSEYVAYHGAKTRCTNPNIKGFEYYGGRGIQFLFTSFEEFFAEVGLRPSPSHSIDRYPNSEGHYQPGNVRWATKTEQRVNQRRVKNQTFSSIYHGVSKSGNGFQARIQIAGKRMRLGTFDIEDDAGRAYNTAAKKLFGEFARLNAIPEISPQEQQ
jgi:hypothetical protein